MIGSYPIDPRNDSRNCTRASATNNANWNQCYVLRDAVGRSSKGACDVRAVARTIVAPIAVVNRTEPGRHATTKFAVRGANACVDNIGRHAGASRVEVISAV